MNEENKLKSRKFIVWLTWLIITLAIIVIQFIKKDLSEEMLLETLKYFFGVSMLYLGANAAQKVGLSFAEGKQEENK